MVIDSSVSMAACAPIAAVTDFAPLVAPVPAPAAAALPAPGFPYLSKLAESFDALVGGEMDVDTDDIDGEQAEDPLQVKEYVAATFKYLRDIEVRDAPARPPRIPSL